jgi:N-acetylmuramoyl-L-alanine amidase
MNITQNPSPNFGSRNGYKPEMIVIHCTDGNFPYDMEYLQNPNPGTAVGPVSAHFVVAPQGDVHQLVDTANAAWHAGRVDHPTATLKMVNGVYVNPNYYSIGIETSMFANGHTTPQQDASLKQLIQDLGAQFAIPLDRTHVVGHREIYSLKTCPGTIDVPSLLPQISLQQTIVNEVAAMIPKVNALPEPQRTTARALLSTILSEITALFK